MPLRLPSFGKASLPFIALLSRIDHVVSIADLDYVRRQHAVAVPRIPVGRRREYGIVGIWFKRAEVAGADVPDPPEVAVVAAVQNMEVLRPLEQFRLTNGPAVPCLPAAFEDGIGRILCDRCRVAGRSGRMTHGQSVMIRTRRLARIDDMNRLAHHNDGRVRRAVPLVVGIGGNHRGWPDSRPLAHITVADKQAGLLGRGLSLAPIVHVEFVVGGVQEREGVLDGLVVETFLRWYDDGITSVLRDVSQVVGGRRSVHNQPASTVVAFAPVVVYRLVDHDGVRRRRPERRFEG